MQPSKHLDDNRLVDFTEGQLEPEARAEVERHLDECPACRSLVAELVKSESVLLAPSSPSPPAPPAAGEPLVLHKGSTLGRYVILERLGAGGMGVVYAAYDPELDRRVSLKLLRTGVIQGATAAEARSRLLREAQAMARLSHPNVIAVHDVGTIGEQVFFAMEYVDGGTLTHWLKETRRTTGEKLDIFLKAGRGLAAAHAAGLVHRDFKPDNVLVGKDGRVRVTDFGLARPAASTMTPQIALSREDLQRVRAGTSSLGASLTRAGSLVGTPAYMAPEQLQGRPTDERTDQFSFCVALYEALYGERPLRGSTIATLSLSAELGLISPAPQDSDVPERLRKVLLRGLSSSAEARYPTLEALLAELSRLPPRVRRRRIVAAVATALLASGGLLAWALSGPPEPALCQTAERRLSGIWDEARKQVIREAFAASGAPHAAAAWGSLERLVDGHASRWVAMRDQACESSRGLAPEEQVAERMACLGVRRAELHALTRIWSRPDERAIERAIDAAVGLEELRTCAAEALRPKPPGDEATRDKVVALRTRLVELKAEADLGRTAPAPALALAAQAVRDARALRYRPVEAEALLALARIEASELRTLGEAGDEPGPPVRDEGGAPGRGPALAVPGEVGEPHPGARHPGSAVARVQATLLDCVHAAEAGLHDEVLARARTLLAEVSGLVARRSDLGLAHATDALAVIEGLGGAPSLEADALVVLGRLHAARGEHPEALRSLEQALSREEEVRGPDHPRLAAILSRLSRELSVQGRAAEATATASRAHRMVRQIYGDHHPKALRAIEAELVNRQGPLSGQP